MNRLTPLVLALATAPVILPAQRGGAERGAAPPAPVTIALAAKRDIPVVLSAVGSVEPSSIVEIKARVRGKIEAALVREGSQVKPGDVLFRLDTRPYEALLNIALANRERDRTDLELARVEQKRSERTFTSDASSRAELDTAKARAAAMEAAVAADDATIAAARLPVEFCAITSPIGGRAGAILVHPGNIVKEDDTDPLVVIHQVQPVNVAFSVPESYLGDIRRRQEVSALAVEVSVPGSVGKPIPGKVTFIDNTVDSRAGRIRLKAECANSAEELWPGQYVNVELVLTTRKDAVVVPREAVQTGQRGQYAYVVKPDMTAEFREIATSDSFGDDVVVERGLAAGETVVTDGQLRLTPGAKVDARPSKAPGP